MSATPWRRLVGALTTSAIVIMTLLPTAAGAAPPYPPDIPFGQPPEVPQQVPSVLRLVVGDPARRGSHGRVLGQHPVGAAGCRARHRRPDWRDWWFYRARRIYDVYIRPFHLDPYFNSTPTIHVGFENIYDPTPPAQTWNGWPCEHFITVDNVDWTWDFGSPGFDAHYYTSGLWDGSGSLYFRISYQHELLHAFGLSGHPDDVVSRS